MLFEFEKAFVKDFRRVKSKELAKSILNCIEQVSKASSLSDIPNLKKLSGYKSAYRIRISDFGVGVIYKNNKIIFVAFAHRKDIYKSFPEQR